jgi:hypothetical protein
MSQVDKAQVHDFTTGETVTEAILDQNTEVLRVAHNDTDNRVVVLENAQAGAMTGIRSGTAFPTSPVPKAGDKFYRTDLHQEFTYTEAYSWEELSYSKTESDNKFVSASGERIEIVEMTITTNGASSNALGSATFSKTYSSAPIVSYCYVSNSVGYSDVMLVPFIKNITTTGFQCSFQVWYNGVQNKFDAGTFKTKFLVFGK